MSHRQAQGAVCGPSAGSNSGCGPVLSAGTQCHSVSHGSFPATLQRDGYVPPTPGFSHPQSKDSFPGASSHPQSKDSFPGASSHHTGGSPHQQGAPLRWPNSLHYMFVARVLVGNAVRGHADYRHPPTVQPGNPLSKQYDCCVDSVADPKIFVVFDSNQTYPEYVVEYSYSASVT
ncbi:hypothetical protein V1264_003708 [Littorina saxatilis]|uniref:PARP catalytic domain-containing protein n=2 Tax=Littorina saxatilis TaxID=31220 RepID=A0AAN9B5L6_9CAEN